ncbi:hypothetical protein DFH09DRAFT_1105120 [Mycena vulgaris]|nr:hypothetical protein DFH09DRAFT_1105120 [Mycena vulgaris]
MYPHTPPYATIPLFQHARRTYLACLRCRKRKIKCLSVDENTPCERCSRRGLDRTQGPRKVMGRPATKTAHQHQSIRENGLSINLNSLRAGTAVPPTTTKSIHQVAQGRYTADTVLYLNYNLPSAAPVLYTPSVARHQLIKEARPQALPFLTGGSSARYPHRRANAISTPTPGYQGGYSEAQTQVPSGSRTAGGSDHWTHYGSLQSRVFPPSSLLSNQPSYPSDYARYFANFGLP